MKPPDPQTATAADWAAYGHYIRSRQPLPQRPAARQPKTTNQVPAHFLTAGPDLGPEHYRMKAQSVLAKEQARQMWEDDDE